jgi:hypothetical protein
MDNLVVHFGTVLIYTTVGAKRGWLFESVSETSSNTARCPDLAAYYTTMAPRCLSSMAQSIVGSGDAGCAAPPARGPGRLRLGVEGMLVEGPNDLSGNRRELN